MRLGLTSLRNLAHTARSYQVHTPHRHATFNALRRPQPFYSARRTFTVSASSPTASEDEDDYDFGSFDVILPEEPYVWGVSHIQPRPVPPHIGRPPYARGEPIHTPVRDKLIQIGNEDEQRLRGAAQLARDVLRFAGSLVEVRVL